MTGGPTLWQPSHMQTCGQQKKNIEIMKSARLVTNSTWHVHMSISTETKSAGEVYNTTSKGSTVETL